LQFLQRLGSFVNFLSWKNSCSPAVNTKSVPQSMHFKNLIPVFHWRGAPSASLLCTGDPNREGSGSQRGQETYIPSYLPLDSARRAVCTRAVLAFLLLRDATCGISNSQSFEAYCVLQIYEATNPSCYIFRTRTSIPPKPNRARAVRPARTARNCLVLLFTCLLAATLAS